MDTTTLAFTSPLTLSVSPAADPPDQRVTLMGTGHENTVTQAKSVVLPHTPLAPKVPSLTSEAEGDEDDTTLPTKLFKERSPDRGRALRRPLRRAVVLDTNYGAESRFIRVVLGRQIPTAPRHFVVLCYYEMNDGSYYWWSSVA
ncbi:hypothetical protein NDU88_004878 [Pleurodeles waltl]|uniref:Uncharacterized protein n=1 Tax=Pleurodeles waltl TaxID=8319 RepID=A0AAV7TSJ0_PLEWA|nr:hypothetical protein NDU88_004878 [Pleurodeles waltl]